MNAAKDRDLIMMAVGDVHISRPDPASVLARVASVLEQGDINLGNLESPNCDRGQPFGGKLEAGGLYLRTAPSNVKGLISGRFKAMGIANNHSLDYGIEGLLQTIEVLDREGIAHAGGGRNIVEARKPAVVEQNGTKVALLSFTSVFPPVGWAADEETPGVATLKIHTAYQTPDNVVYQPGFPPIILTIPDPIELGMLLEDIRHAKEIADIVVLCPHWGVSWGYGRVVGYQKNIARLAIDAGVDLVMGAHPHRLLGMEMYKGKLICYSLGNFVFDGIKMPHHGQDTTVVKCHIRDKRIQKYSLVMARINNDTYQPELLHGQQAVEAAKSLETMSQEFGTTFTAEEGEFTIGGPKPGTAEPLPAPQVYADSLMPIPYLKGGKPFERRQSLAQVIREKMGK